MEEKKMATEAANNNTAKVRISHKTGCKSMNLFSGSTTIVCATFNAPAVPKKPKKTPYRKPILPEEDEIETNTRARSAKLRIAEKV